MHVRNMDVYAAYWYAVYCMQYAICILLIMASGFMILVNLKSPCNAENCHSVKIYVMDMKADNWHATNLIHCTLRSGNIYNQFLRLAFASIRKNKNKHIACQGWQRIFQAILLMNSHITISALGYWRPGLEWNTISSLCH